MTKPTVRKDGQNITFTSDIVDPKPGGWLILGDMWCEVLPDGSHTAWEPIPTDPTPKQLSS